MGYSLEFRGRPMGYSLEFRGRPVGYSLEFRGKEIKNRLPRGEEAHFHIVYCFESNAEG